MREKTVTALKTGLVLRTLFHRSVGAWKDQKAFWDTHTSWHFVLPWTSPSVEPMGGVWEAFCMVSAWYGRPDIQNWDWHGMPEKETAFFYLLYSNLGIMHILSGCSRKSAPLGNLFLLSVSGCPPTTFKKGVQRVITPFCTVPTEKYVHSNLNFFSPQNRIFDFPFSLKILLLCRLRLVITPLVCATHTY